MNHIRAIGVVFAAFLIGSIHAGAATPECKQPPRDQATGKFAYQDVVHVDGVSAQELFRRARTWVATVYKSSNDVVQMADESSGRLIVKGNIAVAWGVEHGWVSHSLTIEIKDGRYRYYMTGFEFTNGKAMGGSDIPIEGKGLEFPRKQLYSRVCGGSEILIGGLADAMKSASPIGDDNW